MLYTATSAIARSPASISCPAKVIYVQIPGMRMRGLNAEGSMNLTDDFKLYASYTYTQATIESNINSYGDGIFPTIGKQLYNTPRNMGFVALNYDHGRVLGRHQCEGSTVRSTATT